MDAFFALFFVLILAAALTWVLAWSEIVRRLRTRHPARYAAIFGTPERRKNGMDRFFAGVSFLLEGGHGALGDGRLLAACWAVKLSTAVAVLSFLGIFFGPFFLLKH